MELPVNPYNISIVQSTEGGDDTAFSAFDNGCKLTAGLIIDFLKEHNHGIRVERWNHGVLEGTKESLAMDSTAWEELLRLCK